MAHFLLRCFHTRSLDETDDAEVGELVDNPESIPRFVWCDACAIWQPVSELVTVAVSTADGGGENGPRVDDEVNAAQTCMEVPGPRAGQSSGTANLESSPGLDAVVPPTVGRHRRSSQSEEYVR
ncbi:hypothetical protein SAMN05216266_13325 [Amycolatopsis marina]|uniref:Uncharacterized protein n=1 Tax=Amycolatopsis marina TaxID=490629 RepID=A0A1I1CKS2_9PSEU|nr:hypothetical protein SAMN05216266_13325 [Amycolatopsis marina]